MTPEVIEVKECDKGRSGFLRRTSRLGDVIGGRKNNFDLIRLGAALLVLLDHSGPITGNPHPYAARLGTSLGSVAITTFFVISGVLIAKSWLHDPSVSRFIAKRALRVVPGLAVCVLLMAFVLGPLATALPKGAYFSDPLLWRFVRDNVTMFPVRYELPGVFLANRYPAAVNGSLWSLPVEIFAYGVLLVIAAARLLNFRFVVALGSVAVALVGLNIAGSDFLGDGIWLGMPTVQIWILLSYFLVGASLYLFRDRVILSVPGALLVVLLIWFTLGTPLVDLALLVGLPYLILTFAFLSLPGIGRITSLGDVSYGIYIYAFPIQQVVALLVPNAGVWKLFGLALVPTYLLALLSWRLIERPALGLKPRSGGAPAVAPASG